MPELPEATNLARQMKAHLTGKTISGIEVLQPKCLNIGETEFCAALTGAQIVDVTNRGKWMMVETTHGWLLISLGMGGEVILTTRDTLPEKHRMIFDFSDGTCIAINFWWFGYAHYASPDGLAKHDMTAKLGPNALDVSPQELKNMLSGKRGQIKSYLLDQSRLAGIGNFYIQDILFRAKLHPQRRIESLSEAEINRLAQAIQQVLAPAVEKGGAFYEMDLFGKKGRFEIKDMALHYAENEPCPVCATPIVKIKTGSTSSLICPQCQPLQ